ncbi:MAG: hypothetical protein OEP48_14885 [Betaproteobacteria bacterium]|nr:hypothetical protein [Betaproteobacteria bacterium]MDH3437011.1 hypothetical protein [Betaproteobacteria bacterium]
MRPIAYCLLLVAVLFWSGCASVPKESVELSVTVGRDLVEVHRANRDLAEMYFKRTRDDVNTFIDTVYRPYMVKKTMEDFELVKKISEAPSDGGGPDALAIMNLFVRKLSKQIEDYRKELVSGVDAQEKEVIDAINASYEQLRNANAIVTGHLASIRKVHDAQDELLSKAGLGGLRETINKKGAEFSDQVEELLEKGQKAEGKIDKIEAAIEDLRKLTAKKLTRPSVTANTPAGS